MSLQGNLSDLPFSDLLNIITRKNNNGILRITYANNLFRATVLVCEAELYAAWVYEVGSMAVNLRYSGENALHSLLACDEGEFSFELIPSDYNLPSRNITSSKREIMLANVFQADDFRVPATLATSPNVPTSPGFSRAVTHTAPMVGRGSPQLSYAGPRAEYSQTNQRTDKSAPKPQRGWISSLITRLRSI